MSANQTQKALLLTEAKGPLELQTIPIPVPKEGEVLVKVEAAALNPVDWKIRDYGMFLKPEEYPALLGTDVAGEVVDVADGVKNVKKGDQVLFQGTFRQSEQSSGYQQYSRASSRTLAKIPSNVTVTEASTVPVTLTCAYVGLYCDFPYGFGFEPPVSEGGLGKYESTPLVVLGGATSVGQYVVQLARLSGFSPIITTASPQHEEYLKSLGATHVLDRSLDPGAVQTAIADLTSAPIKTIYDTVSSPDTQKTAFGLLAPGGQMGITTQKFVDSTDEKKVIGVFGVKAPHTQKLLEAMYDKLEGWLQEGAIKPNRVEVIPGGLNGIVEGLQRLKDNKVSGSKLVVLPHETV
ncbi:chaperonin 10-like protein [Coprinopsis sp. MPI-PUGE-AT-0042]|nr:chaperonin 10-like protein [Coprinopsis sp. MPI-PUGE-AT-0042]